MGEVSESRRIDQFAFVIVAAWLAWRTLARLAAAWAFSTDDAYITLRYARHLLAGEGLVWNVGGPRVEGYSNFLYVLIAAGFGAVGELDIGPLKLLGCAGLLAVGYLQWAIARRFVRPLPALVPFAIYTLERGATWWAVSGLETLVYAALGCGVVLASLRGLGYRRVELGTGEVIGVDRGPIELRAIAGAGGLCVLASLLRPEGPLFAIAVVVVVAIARALDGPGGGHGRAVGVFAAVFVPAIVVYFGWRLAYFGELLPNTVRCKTGHGDRLVLLRAYWSAAPLVLVVALIQPLRSLDARVLLPLVIAAGYALALIGADPVVGHELRHVLAAHALICVLTGVAAVRVAALIAGRIDPRTAELVLVAVVLAGAGLLGEVPDREVLRERAAGYLARSETRAELGRHLARELGPGEVAVLGDVGVAGHVGDAAILDSFCLNEPALARPPLRGRGEDAAAWILAQEPALIVVHTRHTSKLEPRGQIYRDMIVLEQFQVGWTEQRRFNSPGRFHYVVFRRVR